MENKLCKVCNSVLDFHEAGFRKDGSEYKSFYGCKNYKDAEHRAEKEKYLTKVQPKVDGNAMIIDEMQEEFKKLNERMDGMSKWFVEHSKKWEKN